MKHPLFTVLKILLLIILLNVQISLLQQEHQILLNPLLLACIFNIATVANYWYLATSIILLDLFTFLITGYFGFTTILLTLMAILHHKIRHNFYNTLVLPIMGIALYHVYLLFFINNQLTLSEIQQAIIAILYNSLAYYLIIKITKQPIHNS